jgi:copper resistance protein D
VLPDASSAALRALSFVGIFQASGIAIFVAIFYASLEGASTLINRIGRIATLVALVSVLSHAALEASRMTGDFNGVFDLSLQRRVLASAMGAATGLRVAGLLMLLAGLLGSGSFARLLAVTGATLSLFSFAFVGHTSVDAARWLLAPLLLAHVMVVAFWFGALIPLFTITLRESPSVAAQIVEHFSRIALWLVPVILVAGIAIALVLIPSFAAFREAYGMLLLTKIAGFGLLMGLAAANKWQLGPAIAKGNPSRVRRFRRVLAFEYTLIIAVLAITAVMTSFFSPESSSITP